MSCSARILTCNSHKGYCHTNKGYCANEHVQKITGVLVGDSVSSALASGIVKTVFLVIDPVNDQE